MAACKLAEGCSFVHSGPFFVGIAWEANGTDKRANDDQ